MNRLRGVNFGGWLSQIDAIKEKDPAAFPGTDLHMQTFLGKDDFAQVKRWGFNHVRLPIDFYLFFDQDENPIQSRITNIDNAVKWAEDNSLYLILDLHECPGHDFADSTDQPVQKLFDDPTYLLKTEKIWAFLAERYNDKENVIFEVLNEPVAPNAEIWNQIKDKLCKNIRRYAPRNKIITGSNMWNWPSTFKDLTPVDTDSVIYCFHFYEPLLFTHQNAPWVNEPEIKQERDYPGDYGNGFIRKYGLVMSDGYWDRDRFRKELENVTAFREKYKVEVVCDEFGVYAPVPLQAQLRWLEDLLIVLKEMEIGFSYWNYKNLDFGIISKGESLHQNLPQYSNPERINYEVLSILKGN